MFNRFLLLAAAVLSLGSCAGPDSSSASMQSQDFVSDGSWHEIAPSQIPGNFVQMMDDAMLLTAGDSLSLNTMTIGWGQFGKLWRRPVVSVFVSSSRYTHDFVSQHDYFTVTAFPEQFKGNVMYMGKKSGRDEDKIARGGLHSEFTPLGNPIFSEANLAIECRKLYTAVLDSALAPADCKDIYQKVGPHTMFVGEIVKVYRK